MEQRFTYDQRHQADFDEGLIYYWYKNDKEQYEKYLNTVDFDDFVAISEHYCRQKNADEADIALLGLAALINDGCILSPAFVAWERIPCFLEVNDDPHFGSSPIDDLISLIKEPQKVVDLLTYLISSAEIVYPYNTREAVRYLKALLPKYKGAAKIRKQELARQAAEQRQTVKRPKPELVLTLDDIIEYTHDENPEGAHSIRAMLYWMVTHRKGWSAPSIIKKIDAIGKKPDILLENKGTLTANINSHVDIHQ